MRHSQQNIVLLQLVLEQEDSLQLLCISKVPALLYALKNGILLVDNVLLPQRVEAELIPAVQNCHLIVMVREQVDALERKLLALIALLRSLLEVDHNLYDVPQAVKPHHLQLFLVIFSRVSKDDFLYLLQ